MEDTGITGIFLLIVATQASLFGLACVAGYLELPCSTNQ
jgi:hypothetical protein